MRVGDARLAKAISTAWLLLLVAFAAAFLIIAQIRPAAADEDRGELRVGPIKSGSNTVTMIWRGKVAAPMAAQIREAFERHRSQATRIVLTIDSGGGSVAEGERTIEVLRRIRETHHLTTVVAHGQKCGSMCVFIYLQGQERVGAMTSAWLFHEITTKHPGSDKIVLNRPLWEQLVEKYFRPAGVSEKWIGDMKLSPSAPTTGRPALISCRPTQASSTARSATTTVATSPRRLRRCPASRERRTSRCKRGPTGSWRVGSIASKLRVPAPGSRWRVDRARASFGAPRPYAPLAAAML